MLEQESPILCNANRVEGCGLFEGYRLDPKSTCPNPCRGGQWENPYVLENGKRVQPCGATLEPDPDFNILTTDL